MFSGRCRRRVVAPQNDAVPAGVAELDAAPEKLQQSTHDPVLPCELAFVTDTNLSQEWNIHNEHNLLQRA